MFPDKTIEDLKINAMHDALERARASLKQQSSMVDIHDFSLRFSKPCPSYRDEGLQKYECRAEITLKVRIIA